MNVKALGVATAIAFAAAGAANATVTQVDLSPYVNEGFTNAWFINGAQFAGAVGSTFGNQGSTIPFLVANPSDGAGGNNNYWFGLFSGPGSLFGPPGSLTIPVAAANVTSVYTLADNTFGGTGLTEFNVTFTGSGGSITDLYVGGTNTKDYNVNCATTGCAVTPGAQYFFIDAAGGQWLQTVQWNLPANFGLTSITFNQVNGSDGAILAGLTLVSNVPEPASWALMLVGFGGLGAALRGGRRVQKAEITA